MIYGGTGWGIGQIPGEKDKMVLRTTDNAERWKNVTPSQAVYDYADKNTEVSGCFRDANHAWLIFYEKDAYDSRNGIVVWYTEDGGQAWESVNLPISGYAVQYLSDPQISFLDNQNGWIFARIGRSENREYVGIYTTHDGGKSWTAMVTTNSDNLPVRACGGKYIITPAAPCPCAMVILSCAHGRRRSQSMIDCLALSGTG